MKNEAIGTWEAACLMGTHWTRPKRMAEAGLISSRAICGGGGREFAVYSARECEENFREYERLAAAAKRGGGRQRPRTAIQMRPDAIRRLSGPGRVEIEFEDAIGVTEAAQIIGVVWTRVVRMVEEGKIAGRVLWSERGGSSRLWILSRKSCVAWGKEIRRLEAAGLKKGRPRKSVAR